MGKEELMTKFYRWFSWKIPKELVYFCGIRILAHASGKDIISKHREWVNVQNISLIDALKYWDREE